MTAQPRANWKGYLKIAELTCPVALIAAASSSERIALHTVHRETGHRLRRQFVDSMTGDAVDRDDQVKGYAIDRDQYVTLEPEEVESTVPANDKTLLVKAFVGLSDVDDVYFDRPYYLVGSDRSAGEAFALIREGLRATRTAAIAEAVLFRRARTVLVRAFEGGLAANTLHFDYEVRSAREAFAEVPDMTIKGEMLDLAGHIIETKRAAFDPGAFHDRYEAALAELVKAKLDGRALPAPPRARPKPPADLLAALRESAGLTGAAEVKRRPRKESAKAAPRKKAS